TIIILRGDQLRNLIVQRHLSLQHVEAWNCSRFEAVLLVFQLTLQQVHGLFLHFDKLSIDHDLVELRFHSREQLVQNIAEREVGTVPLKESSPDLLESGAITNHLCSDKIDAVRYVAEFSVSDGRR